MKYSSPIQNSDHQVGEDVFFIEGNSPKKAQIQGTHTQLDDSGLVTRYNLLGTHTPDKLYSTKEDMIFDFTRALYSFDYSPDEFEYMYQDGNSLKIKTPLELVTIDFSSHVECRQIVYYYCRSNWKAIGCIGCTVTERVYLVSLDTLVSFSAAGNIITLVYPDGNLDVTSNNSGDNISYLNFVWKNYDPLTRAFAGKSPIRVSPALPTVAGVSYSNLQPAIDYLDSHSTTHYIELTNGEYSGSFTYKNGEWYIQGATITNSGNAPILIPGTGNISCSIYGDARIIDTSGNNISIKHYGPTELSLSWEYLSTNAESAITNSGDAAGVGKVRIKAREAYGKGLINMDVQWDLVDVDISYAKTDWVIPGNPENGGNLFYCNGVPGARLYFRNIYHYNSGGNNIGIDTGTQQPRDFNLIYLVLVNDQPLPEPYFVWLEYNTNYSSAIWSLYLDQKVIPESSYSIVFQGPGVSGFNVNLYGSSYSNALDSAIGYTGSGSWTRDINLTI